MNAKISNLSPEEFKQKRDLLVRIYLEGYKGLEEYAYSRRSDVKGYLNWLYRGDPDGFFVAQEEGSEVGFLGCVSNWFDRNFGLIGEIHELVVLPEKRNQGIGSALLKEALIYLKNKGHERIGLWVGKNNERAKAFYKKFGFKEVGGIGIWIRMILTLEP